MFRALCFLLAAGLIAGASAGTVTLIPLHSTWKYLDNGSNQGLAWTAAAFDDSAWAQGAGPLGYGDGDEATVVGSGPNASSRYITTYFRRHINLTETGEISSAVFRLVRDDGIVVYVNGTEAFRNNMPAGALDYSTRALTAIGGPEETAMLTVPVPSSLLVDGDNVIAVEIHQADPASSDISFDLELTATLDAGVPVANEQAIILDEDTPSAVTLTGSDPDGDLLTYAIVTAPSKGTLSGTPPNLTYTPLAESNGADSFTFRVNDGGNNSPAATVFLTVMPVNDSPVAMPQSVMTPEDTPLTVTLPGGDAESHFGTLADYTQQQYFADLGNIVDGLSGATWNESSGTLFMIRNASGAGHCYEYSADGTCLRTITQSGFSDTEAIAWMHGNTFAVGEETNFQRITICTIAPGALTLDRTAPGHVTWNTVLGNPGNLGLECLCYDAGRDRLYYLAEKPSAGAWNIYAMDPATGVSTVLCDLKASVFTSGVATDLSDMAHDPATDTLLLLSQESNKVIRVDRSGTLLETRGFTTGLAQAEALALTPDRQRLFIGGEPKQFSRYALPADNLTFAVSSLPAHGRLSGIPPLVTYTPDADYQGPDSFGFTVSDGTLVSAPALVAVTVSAVNDAPVPGGISVTVPAGETTSIVLPATDVDGDPLTFQAASLPVHGTLGITGNIATYTAVENFTGTDSFLFTVSDGAVTPVPATVTISVTPYNRPPLAGSTTVQGNEDASMAVSLMASDPEQAALTWTVATLPEHGVLSGTAPYLTFTPEKNYHGTDGFTFYVSDGVRLSGTAAVTIAIAPVNDPPTASAGSLSTAEDTASGIVLSGVDIDGDALVYAVSTPPLHGALSGTAPNLIYTPAPDYHGPDGFSFTVSDAVATPVPADILISVTSVNDAPAATAQAVTTDEDSPTAVTLAGTDAEGDSLSYVITRLPAHGTLGGTPPNMVYTPDANYHGIDSFSFKASDGTEESGPAVVSLSVVSVNDVPLAASQLLPAMEDTSLAVTLTASDEDGEELDFTVTVLPEHGSLTGTPPMLIYTPDPDYNGPDSFSFRANDREPEGTAGLVQIGILPVNDPPEGSSDAFAVDQDTTLVPGFAERILLNDRDDHHNAPGESNIPLSAGLATPPSHAQSFGLNPDGTFTYTPRPFFYGMDSFTYRALDSLGAASAPATVHIIVRAANQAPVVESLQITTMENVPVSVTLHSTDPDLESPVNPESDASGLPADSVPAPHNATPLYTILSPPQHGSLSGTPPELIYAPAADYSGPDSFTFSVSDGRASSAPATVTIAVIADSDHDSLPDPWELAAFGDLHFKGSDDPDGDRQDNTFEFISGHDPRDASDFLSMEYAGPVAAIGTFRLNRVIPGVLYHLHGSDDLESWESLAEATYESAGPGFIRDPGPATAGRRFYRVTVSRN